MREKPILKLERIVTNNWGTSDHQCINFSGDRSLMIGPNGAGKSTTLHAFLAICNGSLNSRHFNPEKMDRESMRRTALSYARGATKYNPAGKRKGFVVTTNVAIEWHDEEKDRYYVSGLIMENVKPDETKSIPEHKWFIFNGRVPEDELINYTVDKLKTLVASRNREYEAYPYCVNQVFATDESYRSTLFDRVFGGVDPKSFEKLQNASVNLKMDKKEDAFIKEFMFPYTPDKINESLSEKITALRNIERLLEETGTTIGKLEEISSLVAAYEEASSALQTKKEEEDYISYQLLHNRICEEEKQSKVLKENLETTVLQKEDVRAEKNAIEEERVRLTVALDKSDYQQKRQELENKTELVRSLLGNERRFTELQARVDRWKEYQEVTDLLTGPCETAIEDFCKGKVTDSTIQSIRQGLKECREDLENMERDAAGEVRDANRRVAELKEELKEYRENRRHYRNSADLEYAVRYLKKRLKEKTGQEIPVEVFSRTFDVIKPEWKNTIEGILNQSKAMIIVPPEYAMTAMQIKRSEMKDRDVGIIDSGKAVKVNASAMENSLYECVSREKEYIDATLRFYLGKTIMCSTEEELRASGNGATTDCHVYKGIAMYPLNRASYTKFASIGKDIPKEIIEAKETELQKAESVYLEKSAALKRLKDALQFETLSLYQNEELIELAKTTEKIKRLNREIATLQDVIKRLETNESKELLEAIEEAKQKQMYAEAKIEELNGKIAVLTEQIESKKKTLWQYRKELENIDSKLPDAISEKVLKGSEKWFAQHPTVTSLDTARHIFEEEREALSQAYNDKKTVLSSRKALFNSTHPGFGFDDTDNCNDLIIATLQKMKAEYDADLLPKCTKMREDTSVLFRRTTINTLHAMIEEAKRMVAEYNMLLRDHPFGNDVYFMKVEASDDAFGDYYDMLTSKDLNLIPDLEISDYQLSLGEKNFFEKYRDKVTQFMSMFEMPVKEKYPSQEAYENDCKRYQKRIDQANDFRSYLKFSMKARKVQDESGDSAKAVSASATTNSGGEGDNSKYIAIFMGFMRLYRHEAGRNVTPGIIFMDEALQKMDEERSRAIFDFMERIGLQIVMCAPGKERVLLEYMDSVNLIDKDENEVMRVAYYNRAAVRKTLLGEKAGE